MSVNLFMADMHVYLVHDCQVSFSFVLTGTAGLVDYFQIVFESTCMPLTGKTNSMYEKCESFENF